MRLIPEVHDLVEALVDVAIRLKTDSDEALLCPSSKKTSAQKRPKKTAATRCTLTDANPERVRSAK